MEAEEQQLPGPGNRGQGAASLNTPGDPEANMQPTVRLGCGGARLPPMTTQASQTGYTNPPVQSPDALAVVSVLPLINMVRSQDVTSPHAAGVQQKLLMTRTTILEHEDIILQTL
jgi:hypothetical protein